MYRLTADHTEGPYRPRYRHPGTWAVLFLALLIPFATLPAWGAVPKGAAIATAHPIATAAGHEILAAGGNAFDAAIAISATLAVVEPYSSGIGGGGFWLIHRANDSFETMIDGREQAPGAAHRDMYLGDDGEVIKGLSMYGPLAAGIPGEPAALAHLARHYGRLPLKKSLAPAIRAAREGFAVTEHYRKLAKFQLKKMQENADTAAVFLYKGELPPVGHLVRQPELAWVLEQLAEQGADGFYKGPVARKLVEGVKKGGGLWTLEDLAQYKVVERKPVKGSYRGITVTSAPPPSSGGIALVTMLNILEGFKLEGLSPSAYTHLTVEAMRRAYRDRAEYLGDPDFVSVPTQKLIAKDYAAGLRATIQPDKATPSSSLKGVTERPKGRDTTHFSVLDRDGNRVSATLSINYPFGAVYVPAGTGVLLNNEMDDFSAKPGVPNVYGLVGAAANAIAPGKRPLSSMTPTFLESDDRVAILGTPGGSRIITMVLLGSLEFAAGKPPAAWVERPRFHHQFLPDQIQFEPGALDETTQKELTAMGHHLKAGSRTYGNMQAILWDKRSGKLQAASDPRGIGQAEIRPAQ